MQDKLYLHRRLYFDFTNPDKLCSKAVEALGKESIPEIMLFLEDSDYRIRCKAVWALAQLKAKEAIPKFVDLLYDYKYEVSLEVIKALGQLGDKEAIVPLMDLLKYRKGKKDRYVRCEVVCALKKLNAKEAIPILIDLLKKDRVSDVCLNAIWALERLEAREAINPLCDLINRLDNDNQVRREAVLIAPSLYRILVYTTSPDSKAYNMVRRHAARVLDKLQRM